MDAKKLFLAFSLACTLLLAPAALALSPEPVEPDEVLVIVGKTKITAGRIMDIINKLPYKHAITRKKRAQLANRYLQEAVLAELQHHYLVSRNISYSQEDVERIKEDLAKMIERKNEIAKVRRTPKITVQELMASMGLTEERLRDEARQRRLIEELTGEEKIKTFIKSHPSYFDGTKVQASHILVACEPLASTARQRAAMDKLAQLADRIRAGKLKFEDAAAQHSDCPSKSKGGDLGKFTFSQMVPPFAMAAFDAKVGQVTDIVRTQFGFHLIKVIARIEGKGKPGPNAERIAKTVLLNELQDGIFAQILTTCPIVIPSEQQAATQPKTNPTKKQEPKKQKPEPGK